VQVNSDRDIPNHHGHGAAVRFYDDMDTHQMHQGLRDLSSHQIRVGDDLDKEIDRRNRWEIQSKRTFAELHEALRKPDLVSGSR